MNTNLKKTRTRSLRFRLLLTVSLLTLVRLGSFIPVPFLDREVFNSLLQTQILSTNPVTQALNMFSGTANTSFGLLSLGILPYINASILVQLLSTAIPALSKMQKEEGEYGRRKLTGYTRLLTLLGAIIESISVSLSLREIIFDWNWWVALQISVTLVAGSMIVLWFSELITRLGLGNGSSLLICFNIISSLPDQIKGFLFSFQKNTATINGLGLWLSLLGIFLITTLGCIYINEATIRIPLISARQLLRKEAATSKGKQQAVGNTSLPLRINQAGVMPLIFTSYTMVLFSLVGQYIKKQLSLFDWFVSSSIFNETLVFWSGKVIFFIVYASLIFFFTYVYSTIILDPKDVAENFRKNSVVIVGIPPGRSTKRYLRQTLKRIARINATFLICNILGLQVIESVLHLNLLSVRGLGFTSQLILVNVLIDTTKRVRSFLNEEENNWN